MQNQSKYANKTVLLIAPVFFGYHKNIKSEIERKGGRVFFFPEKPVGVLRHFFRSISARSKKRQYEQYGEKLLKRIISHNIAYDYVIAIRSEILTADFYGAIRMANRKALFVLYQWDSLKYINYMPLLDSFDSVFSFDYDDVQKDNRIKLLPLFYIYGHAAPIANVSYKYDCLFYGSVNADRQEVLNSLATELERNGLSFKFYIYFPFSTLIRLFFTRKITTRLKYIKTKSLTKGDIQKMMQSCKYVIDINTLGQSGLTMRTFESLAVGKILITTNESITREKILPGNYLVIDRKMPVLNGLNNEYAYDKMFNDTYSLSSWLENLIV
jgi:hypothetical protein